MPELRGNDGDVLRVVSHLWILAHRDEVTKFHIEPSDDSRPDCCTLTAKLSNGQYVTWRDRPVGKMKRWVHRKKFVHISYTWVFADGSVNGYEPMNGGASGRS